MLKIGLTMYMGERESWLAFVLELGADLLFDYRQTQPKHLKMTVCTSVL